MRFCELVISSGKRLLDLEKEKQELKEENQELKEMVEFLQQAKFEEKKFVGSEQIQCPDVESFEVEKDLVAFLNDTDVDGEIRCAPMVFSVAFERLCREFLHSSNCRAIDLYYETTLAASWISLRAPFFNSLAQNFLVVQHACGREVVCVHMEMCRAECEAEMMIMLGTPSQSGEKEKIVESFETAISRLEKGKEEYRIGLLRCAILKFRLAKHLTPKGDRVELLKELKLSLSDVPFEKESTLRFERMARELRSLANELEFCGIIAENAVECWMKYLWDE